MQQSASLWNNPRARRQISQLEEELGVELFHRTKRGVALTEAGQAFLDEARLTLAQAERAAKAAQQAVRTQSKKLTIGFSICAFNRVLPEVIQRFRQMCPDADVTLTEMSRWACPHVGSRTQFRWIARPEPCIAC